MKISFGFKAKHFKLIRKENIFKFTQFKKKTSLKIKAKIHDFKHLLEISEGILFKKNL